MTTSSKKKYSSPKLFEFRIKYNAGAGHSAQDSYHYYNAEDAQQALEYHESMMKRRGYRSQFISIEKKNPYTNKWEGVTLGLDEH
tara:strand:+ start:57 stop:311 length:255 start_codon:yes stop_codon:yes gene_type:complete